ncbi:carbamoyltransferase [bacterium]|nr:carbamoyltransferase [candidate division CSSED10-310 bacterium]
MKILGISSFYHDSAAALVEDGDILAAAQEERFTRIKHDQDFPENAVQYCLKEASISIDDVDLVAFYDKPLIKFERLLETYLMFAPRGIQSFMQAMPLWLKRKLMIPKLISKTLGYKGPMIFPQHHESHAASAFFPTVFDRAAIITFDGVGEWTTTSYGLGDGNTIRLLAEIHFPHSIGLLYSAFTYFTGFRVNSGEYKVMGLAPYGEPKYKDVILKELVDLKEDGSYRLNMKYFNYCTGLTMTNDAFADLFGGPPRQPESDLTQREMDLARSVQEVTEEIMLRTARYVHKLTGEKKLCIAGGVGLNCVGNGRLLREGPFEEIWIQPASGDAGGALGAALYGWYQYAGNARDRIDGFDRQKGSYLGPEYSNEEIQSFLDRNGYPHTRYEHNETPDVAAALLEQENVVGWFQGRMEFGPRALGNRSIIGDARSPKMQKTINLKIKYRESFRPFAPTVLEERISEYFEIDRPSPYMLLTAPVRSELRRQMTKEEQDLFGIDKLNIVRSTIPAVTHVDYSARIQSVSAQTNPRYHALIKAFENRTGCGVIINTSFNVRGEPIVCSPEDAYKCFMRTEMDYLVLGDFVLDKLKQPKMDDDRDWRNEFKLD